jgi:hypothetical protein
VIVMKNKIETNPNRKCLIAHLADFVRANGMPKTSSTMINLLRCDLATDVVMRDTTVARYILLRDLD